MLTLLLGDKVITKPTIQLNVSSHGYFSSRSKYNSCSNSYIFLSKIKGIVKMKTIMCADGMATLWSWEL